MSKVNYFYFTFGPKHSQIWGSLICLLNIVFYYLVLVFALFKTQLYFLSMIILGNFVFSLTNLFYFLHLYVAVVVVFKQHFLLIMFFFCFFTKLLINKWKTIQTLSWIPEKVPATKSADNSLVTGKKKENTRRVFASRLSPEYFTTWILLSPSLYQRVRSGPAFLFLGLMCSQLRPVWTVI